MVGMIVLRDGVSGCRVQRGAVAGINVKIC